MAEIFSALTLYDIDAERLKTSGVVALSGADYVIVMLQIVGCKPGIVRGQAQS
jgi:hypothetical protein